MNHASRPTAERSLVERLSQGLARVESVVIGALMLSIFGLLMLNVVSRALGAPVIWVDEAAVFLMAWVALFGASLALARREHIAVTLVPDMLSDVARYRLARAVDVLLLGFFVLFAVVLWRWFDPVTLWQAGSIKDFSRATFNFIYQEPTVTLGVRKIWFWLILPVFCLSGLVHSIAHLTARREAAP
ncbi:TRAP transporter small permease subunit [Rhodobacteraceae bacterium F11138]|nr:TRAP transporter small permease subunit [Rhodobacteraceae bacterium F11138]